MRAPDGVHLERAGGDIVAKEVARQVRRGVRRLELADSIACASPRARGECIVFAMRALALPVASVPRARLCRRRPAYAQAEEELAERYAPVVRLVEQEEECGPGEPYEPIDIDAILDEDTVSLRGPWRSNDLVEIAPRPTTWAGASTSTTSTSPATR